jgi:hypothetical protein
MSSPVPATALLMTKTKLEVSHNNKQNLTARPRKSQAKGGGTTKAKYFCQAVLYSCKLQPTSSACFGAMWPGRGRNYMISQDFQENVCLSSCLICQSLKTPGTAALN